MAKYRQLFVAIANRNDPKMIKLINEMTIEEVNANPQEPFKKFLNINNTANVACTALHIACLTNNTTAIAMLLVLDGIQVNQKFSSTPTYCRGIEVNQKFSSTARYENTNQNICGPSGHCCGVDIRLFSNNFENYDGYTPIMIAAELKHKEAFELLLQDNRVDLKASAGYRGAVGLAEMFAAHNEENHAMLVKLLAVIRREPNVTDTVLQTRTKLEVFQDHKNNFGKLLESGENSDFNIICGEETFHCHKTILFAQSNVLKTMFHSGMKESDEHSMTIADLEPEIVKQFIKFIYTGSIDVEDAKENATKLLEVADRYELKGLTKLCEGELISTINNNNVLEMVMKADLYHADKLKKASMKWIVKNRTTFVKPEGWMEELAKFPTLMMEIMKAVTS